MKPEIFGKSLERAVEFSELFPQRSVMVSLCGLGEPLLNSRTPSYVRQVREAGFTCALSSNGSLLDESRGAALLEAGLQKICINVGEEGEEYERVYKLPFGKTRDNVVRFAEMARGQCTVEVILVDHRRDSAHLAHMQAYWRERGIEEFFVFPVMNRGGALFVDHMQYESYPELNEARALLAAEPFRTACEAPFRYLFIGYDGLYYLCCSDWKKEVPFGSVFELSFASIAAKKMEAVGTREPICKICSHDPTNRLVEELRCMKDGETDEASKTRLLAELSSNSRVVGSVLETLQEAASSPSADGRPTRRLIPLRVR